jgi:hypothetical protein
LDAEVGVELEGLLVIHPDAEGVIVQRAEKVVSRVRASVASEEPGLSSTQEPHPPVYIPVVEAWCDGRSACTRRVSVVNKQTGGRICDRRSYISSLKGNIRNE